MGAFAYCYDTDCGSPISKPTLGELIVGKKRCPQCQGWYSLRRHDDEDSLIMDIDAAVEELISASNPLG